MDTRATPSIMTDGSGQESLLRPSPDSPLPLSTIFGRAVESMGIIQCSNGQYIPRSYLFVGEWDEGDEGSVCLFGLEVESHRRQHRIVSASDLVCPLFVSHCSLDSLA